jgi:hypothetical protein
MVRYLVNPAGTEKRIDPVASDESLTAHAGLVLFDEYLGAMGIAGLRSGVD